MKQIIKRIIASVIFRINRPFRWLLFYRKRFFRFLLPNLGRILRKKIVYKNYPICSQKLLVSGEGQLEIGENCNFGYRFGGRFFYGLIEIQPRFENSVIKLGNNIITNNNVSICAVNSIEIGDYTMIGENVLIMDHEGHGSAPDKRMELGGSGIVKIGKNVMICSRSIILKNTITNP